MNRASWPVGTLRTIAVGVLMHAKHESRSALGLTIALFVPLVQATLAMYLFGAGSQPRPLLEAAVGAGLMGVWSSVLFGSGGAVQHQRWQGTLEMLVLTPRPLAMVFLPVTLATALTGTYSLLATIGWAVLLFGVPLRVADPVAFAVAVPGCVLGIGLFGLVLAATFVLLRNANALANTLEYPVWLVSGMLVPALALPGWTGPVAAVLPTTWGARAVRAAVSGGDVWPALGWCVALGAGYALLGAVAMRHVEHRARAAATLALS